MDVRLVLGFLCLLSSVPKLDTRPLRIFNLDVLPVQQSSRPFLLLNNDLFNTPFQFRTPPTVYRGFSHATSTPANVLERILLPDDLILRDDATEVSTVVKVNHHTKTNSTGKLTPEKVSKPKVFNTLNKLNTSENVITPDKVTGKNKTKINKAKKTTTLEIVKTRPEKLIFTERVGIPRKNIITPDKTNNQDKINNTNKISTLEFINPPEKITRPTTELEGITKKVNFPKKSINSEHKNIPISKSTQVKTKNEKIVNIPNNVEPIEKLITTERVYTTEKVKNIVSETNIEISTTEYINISSNISNKAINSEQGRAEEELESQGKIITTEKPNSPKVNIPVQVESPVKINLTDTIVFPVDLTDAEKTTVDNYLITTEKIYVQENLTTQNTSEEMTTTEEVNGIHNLTSDTVDNATQTYTPLQSTILVQTSTLKNEIDEVATSKYPIIPVEEVFLTTQNTIIFESEIHENNKYQTTTSSSEDLSKRTLNDIIEPTTSVLDETTKSSKPVAVPVDGSRAVIYVPVRDCPQGTKRTARGQCRKVYR